MEDPVDRLLQQWAQERPELDCSSLSVVVRVLYLAKVLRRDTEKALAALDLKLWEYDVLSILRRQGPPFQLAASELARESMLTSGAMTTRVDRLLARGLVSRQPDTTDRRGINVCLTAEGLRLVDTAIGARLTAAHQQLRALSEDERRTVAEALRKVLLAMPSGMGGA